MEKNITDCTSRSNRFIALDSLRGIAALFVVLYHYTSRYPELFCNNCSPLFEVKYGGYGVELFFILSGFVIFFSASKGTYLRVFVISRLLRLFPVYWVSILITTFFIALFGLEGREVNAETFIVNLTMFQEYFGYDNVDGVYWTLAVEMAFYIVISLLIFLNLLSKVKYLIFTWTIVYVVFKGWGDYIYPISLPSNVIILLDYSLLFCLGVLLNIYYSSKCKLSFIISILVSLVYLFVSSTAVFYITFFIIIVFYMFVIGKLNFIKGKLFLFLGSISYPLYLVHQNIGYILLNELGSLNINIRILITFSFIISLSYFIHLLIEKPFMAFSKNIRNRILAL